MAWKDRINRIRLEFKDHTDTFFPDVLPVLIESDWNLKQYTPEELKAVGEGINRIRLEFKVRKLILV